MMKVVGIYLYIDIILTPIAVTMDGQN